MKKHFYRSPGRVNIIGEHTDYHDGLVMPAAIDLEIDWQVCKRNDAIVSGYSKTLREDGNFNINSAKKARHEWMRYLQGVTVVLKKKKFHFKGVDLIISASLPIGAGLSSSSSLATGFAFILNDLYQLGLNRVEIAQIACEAEWWYGTKGGIMDQFCIANGKKDHAVLLDARSLKYELIKIPREISIVVFNTSVKHKQIRSPFAERRKQAEQVIKIAQKVYKNEQIIKLRDLTLEQLKKLKPHLSEVVFRRAHHPITENERVMQMKQAFEKRDFTRIGRILAASHQSLKENYEVSCKELDKAVEIANQHLDLIGARMVGGGFGDSTINLVKKSGAKKFAAFMEKDYQKTLGLKGKAYICHPSDGVSKI